MVWDGRSDCCAAGVCRLLLTPPVQLHNCTPTGLTLEERETGHTQVTKNVLIQFEIIKVNAIITWKNRLWLIININEWEDLRPNPRS